MKNIKKFLILLVILVGALFFAGCTKDDSQNDYEEKIAELNEKITSLNSEIEKLKEADTTSQNEITDLENEIKDLEEKINSIQLVLNQATYTINIYDIDGELLKSKTINGKKDDKVFDTLKENFNVIYTVSDYGPYITSIENSITDPNYYIAIYENDEYSMVGIDSLVIDNNDVFDFKVICWNTNFDAIDLKVDYTIYSFFKNNLELLTTGTSVDYTLLQAINLMKNNYYDTTIFNADFSNKEACITELNKSYVNETSVGTLFKAAIGAKFFGINNTSLNQAISELNNVASLSGFYSAGYYLIACEKMGISNETYSNVKNELQNLITNNDASDTLCMLLTVLGNYSDMENYSTILNTGLEKIKTTISNDGITEVWSGLNCASTAQGILALCSNNKDPRTFNDCDLIKAIFTFQDEETELFKNKLTSTETDIVFDTPQAISALMAYKVFRDTTKAAPLYN